MDIQSFIIKYRIGLLLSVMASLLYATGSVFSKTIVNDIGASNLSAVRYLVQGYLAMPLFITKAEKCSGLIASSSKKVLFFMVLSGVTVSLNAFTAYTALGIVPIMDATTLYNTQPIWVVIISYFWLKESIGIIDIFSVLLVVTGVVFVCQPEFIFGFSEMYANNPLLWYGYLMGILTGFLYGVTSCLIRRTKDAGSTNILIFQSIPGVIVCLSIGAIIRDQNDPSVSQLLLLAGATICTGLARACLTASLTYEESAIVSLIMTFEILFSLIYQFSVFHTIPNALAVSGACLVMLGVCLISLKDKIKHAMRKCFANSKNLSDEKASVEEKSKLLS